MAKKMMYSFEEKKDPVDGKVSSVMGILSLILLVAAIYSSYYMRGDAGMYAGAMGLSGILFAFVGFLIGVKSFSGKNIRYKYPKMGSILCGILFVVWLGVIIGGI